jgi:hypothetical protein
MRNIRFVYDEPAMIAINGAEKYLVVGDLHIGMERKLRERGVHIDSTGRLSERIHKLAKEFDADRVVMLGDIKESVLYPDAAETRHIRSFFESMGDLSVEVIAGNHDAHLQELISNKVSRELVLGRFAFMHGDKRPSESAMMCDYLVTAHSHTVVRIMDKNGAIYEEKAWVVAGIDESAARQSYARFNKRIKLIIEPAFNDLIMGTAVGSGLKTHNQFFRSGLFDYDKAKVYTLEGSLVGNALI